MRFVQSPGNGATTATTTMSRPPPATGSRLWGWILGCVFQRAYVRVHPRCVRIALLSETLSLFFSSTPIVPLVDVGQSVK